jgi:hypothetical protein
VNQVSYDKWQQIIRLPYLTVLAFWIGQRARLYPSQLRRMVSELEAIQKRDLESLLGQLAADSATELVNHIKTFKADEISHFRLQCARVFTAARAVMTADQFSQYLRDNNGIVRAMQEELPWQGRLRAMLRKPLPQDPRVVLCNALEDAALTPH